MSEPTPRPVFDPLFEAAHYQDGRDLNPAEQAAHADYMRALREQQQRADIFTTADQGALT